MRRFEFVERIKEVAMENTDGAFCKLPERSTAKSGGYDFICPERTEVHPGEIKYVKTGVKAYMEDDEILILCNRSSNPKNKGLVLINGIGIVDADYVDNEDNEGEIAFAFMNRRTSTLILEAGEKLGQGIFVKYGITDDDAAEGERTGGFGSTGV